MKNILIISKDDDTQGSIAAVHQSSQNLNTKITGCAQNFSGAMALIKKTMPELIVCDVGIDDEFDGIEIAQQIRQRFPVAVIFIAENASRKIMEKAQGIPIAGFLTKPFAMDQLRITLKLSLNL